MKYKLMVVSIYDGGYGFSVDVDGNQSYEREFKIKERYDSYKYNKFVKYIKRYYPSETLVICEDGYIDIFKGEQQ